ncbi:S-layer homology domain-containing protein, partial [Bacillus sp. D-CC]
SIPLVLRITERWFTPFIAAVEKAGVVKGKGAGVFDPTGKIDRVSMAAMLVEAYKLEAKVKQPVQTKYWPYLSPNYHLNLQILF